MFFGGFDYRPRFMSRKNKGDFPYDLTFGFEAEVALWIKESSQCVVEAIDSLIDFNHRFYYIKYDGSIHGGYNGAEINSHPFNWNWILNHPEAIESLSMLSNVKGDGTLYYDKSKAYIFKVNRSCGFHIHISRKFLNKKHLYKFMKLIYDNPDMICGICQRKDTAYFIQYSDLHKDEDVSDIIRNSKKDKSGYRYSALNVTPKHTVEIRIFQGTLNEETIWAYLEFALACVLYSKDFDEEEMTEKKLLKYIKENKNTYSNFLKLYNSEITWKQSTKRNTKENNNGEIFTD